MLNSRLSFPMHTTITCTNISEEIMSKCNHTRGTIHMFKTMSQLLQEGLQSLDTSSISLVTYSITHFLSSSFPYFFPCFLCLLLKICKERSLTFYPLRCSPQIAFHQATGNKEGKNGKRESRTKQGRDQGKLRMIGMLIG